MVFTLFGKHKHAKIFGIRDGFMHFVQKSG
jgi:hypothetical protein